MKSLLKPEKESLINPMNKNRNHNPSSERYLPPNQKFKCKQSSSPSKQQSVSNFFEQATSSESGTSVLDNDTSKITNKMQACFDSPYSKIVSEIKQINTTISRTDEADFKTPKRIKLLRSRKINQSKVKRTKKGKNVSSTTTGRNKSVLQLLTKSNFSYGDVNSEHLQMALALSNSTFEIENKRKENGESNEQFISQDQQITSLGKATLETFGFKSGRKKFPVELKKSGKTELPKKSKRSRFAFVTPILKLRTLEDRASLIASKISLILNSSQPEISTSKSTDTLNSDILKGHLCRDRRIFNSNRKNIFYVESLNLQTSEATCGCLLKNWTGIFGRDSSPVRITDKYNETLKAANVNFNENEVSNYVHSSITSKTKMFLQDNTNNLNQNTFNSTHQTVDLELTSCQSAYPKLKSISPDLFDDLNDQVCEISNNSINNKVYSEITYVPTDSRIGTMSPDLFEDYSDDELCQNSRSTIKNKTVSQVSCSHSKKNSYYLLESNSESDEEELSQSLLSPKKSQSPKKVLQKSISANLKDDIRVFTSNLGVQFFESYRSNVDILSKNLVIDLTEDDDDFDRCSPKFAQTELLLNLNPETVMKTNDEVKDANSPQTETNMSQLVLEQSSSSYDTPKSTKEIFNNLEKGGRKLSSKSSKKSLLAEIDQSLHSDCSAMLNVTDYITQMLNSDDVSNQSPMYPKNASGNSSNKNDDVSFGNIKPSETRCSQGKDVDSLCFSQESFIHYSSPHSCQSSKANDNYCPMEDKLKSVSVEEKTQMEIKLSNKECDILMSNISNDHSENNSLNNKEIALSLNKSSDEKANDPMETKNRIMGGITPNSNLVVKTENVTPMANYDGMDTPTIRQELNKFGLKPLKRQKGANLLKYIYEATHPIMENDESRNSSSDDEDDLREIKRTRTSYHVDAIDIVGDSLLQNETDEFIFESRTSAKIVSCQIPLQIVWHNFLSCNPGIKESVLLYEPLNLGSIQSMLKELGFKFKIQDLLNFFDKKCITIRTTQTQNKRKKRR